MPTRTYGVRVACFILCVSLCVLQSGCGSAGGGGTTPAPASTSNAVHLALSTASGFTSVVADGRSAVPIRLQVTNASGAGMSGVPVTFATTTGALSTSPVVRSASSSLLSDEPTATTRADSGASLTVTTDANGIAQVLLTATTTTGTAVVTADVQGFRSNITIAFVPGAPTRVQLTASSTTVNAGGAATLTATVTDANGNTVPGETVTFALSTNASGALPLSKTSGVTDSNGQVTVQYTAGINPGADTVQAKATSTSVAGSVSLTVPDTTSSAAVTSIAVIAGATSVVADGATPVAIRATITVASGSPAGITVTFTTTAGSLSPATMRTDANGVATVNLIAATSLGTATVTAAAGGFSTTTSVNFVAGAPTVSGLRLSATPTTVNTRANATITASVTDAKGNPVKGETLTFSLPTNVSGATLSTLSGPTDASGQFTLTYRAGATPGTDTVQARTANGAIGTVTMTVSATVGNVTGITVLAGATSVVADGATPVAMRTTVTVASGSPAGISVSFATTAGSLPQTTASTDANGVATVNLKAATSLGTATVTAAAGGFSTTTTVTFVAGAPTVVLLSATPPTVNTRANATITASVTDAKGNPVNGQTLTFSFPPDGNASGATLSTLSGPTDASGQFTLTYRAGATLGTDTVQARTANDVSGSVTITVSAVGSNVTGIAVLAGATSVVADGATLVAMRATVTVASGSPAGISVSFATTAGSLPQTTASTDANGVATVNLKAATSLGTATVTAAAGGFSANVTVTFVAGPPDSVTLSASPATVVIGAASNIQATVTDAKGNPTAEQTLVFSFTPNVTGAALTPLSKATDKDGRVTVTYTAGTTPGTDIVQARTVNNCTNCTKTVSITVTPIAGASRIDLLVSSPQLPSSGAGSVTLTALLRDSANNAVSGVLVSFSADSGSIQVTRGTTGPTGTATALLTAGGDQRNRTITVTASVAANLSSSNMANVVGTTLTVSGVTTVVTGGTIPLTIVLSDSSGTGIPNQPITVSSQQGNTLSTPAPTNANGQTTVNVTATAASTVTYTDTITASAMQGTVTGSLALTVSPDSFVFTTPAPPPAAATQVNLNTAQAVTVSWKTGNPPVAVPDGSTVSFFASRGSLAATATCTTGVPTISAPTTGGTATVFICADNAGPAFINAATTATGPSSSIEIDFIAPATSASSLVLQASPTNLGVNLTGSSTQQSIITAVVKDTLGNLVTGATVSFSLQDVSGGKIFPPSDRTNLFGQASTTYTAGSAPSTFNGVTITAAAPGVVCPAPPLPPCSVQLTVAQRPVAVILGTGNVVNTPSSTQYALPYSVLVTDADGNPAGGATVNLTVLPAGYAKGRYVQRSVVIGGTLTCIWAQCITTTPSVCTPPTTVNNVPIPGNVATVPTSVTTDASGFAFFDVTYARQFTWAEVTLQARTVVAGTAGLSSATFLLLGVASDFSNCAVAPPGQLSPFGNEIRFTGAGTNNGCTCFVLKGDMCDVGTTSADFTTCP